MSNSHPLTPTALPSLEEYEKFTHDSAFYPDADEGNFFEINYLVAGIAGEGGEVLDAWKKVIRDLDVQDVTALMHVMETPTFQNRASTLVYEMGDVLWYLTHMLRVLDITYEELALMNAYKLYMRHKERGPHDSWPWPFENITKEEAGAVVAKIENKLEGLTS